MNSKSKLSKPFPPQRVSLLDLTYNIAWASQCGVEFFALEEHYIMISHPKSKLDYCVNLSSPKERLLALKVMINWINGIFPKKIEDVDWP